MSEQNNHAKHGARYKARRHAAEILFEAEARDIDPVEVTRTREELSNGPDPVTAPVRPYTRDIIEGVAVNLDLIDFAIERELAETDWTFDRLPGVDRAVLRVATWELLYNSDDVPQKTAVTQAVELVSELSTDDSPAYVNAVLDAMWKNPESPADALARAEAEAEEARLEAEREAEERRAEAEARAAENAAFTIEGLEAEDDSFAVDREFTPEESADEGLSGAEGTVEPEIGVVSGLAHTFSYSAASDSPESAGATEVTTPEPAISGSEMEESNDTDDGTSDEKPSRGEADTHESPAEEAAPASDDADRPVDVPTHEDASTEE